MGNANQKTTTDTQQKKKKQPKHNIKCDHETKRQENKKRREEKRKEKKEKNNTMIPFYKDHMQGSLFLFLFIRRKPTQFSITEVCMESGKVTFWA